MAKFYKVGLTKKEREDLMGIFSKGKKHTSQVFRNASILLNADEGEYSN